MRLVTASILAERDSLSRFSKRLRKAGFYDVLDLVGNQPQLSFTATYRSRDEAAGPNEFNAAFSYEEGMKNVNDLRNRCGEIDMACLADFLATDAEKIRGARRIRFNAEYTRISRLSFVMPAPGFSYLAEPTERLAASFTFGGYIGREMSGHRRSRFDLSATYEDFSDDPLRQDRGLASATLTYPLMQGFFLSLGAVYATKPEFRGDVDEELSARAGFTYKIIEGP